LALLAVIIGALFILGLIDLHQRKKAQRLQAKQDEEDREARKQRVIERHLAELRGRPVRNFSRTPAPKPPIIKNPSSN
jgi:hypothetical protein